MNDRRRAYWLSGSTIVFILLAILMLQPSDAASISENVLVTGKPCTPTASVTSSGDNGSFDHIYPGAKPASATPVPCIAQVRVKATLTASPTLRPAGTSTPTRVISPVPTGQIVPNLVGAPILVARAIIVDSNLQEPSPNYTVNGKCTLAEAIKAVNTQTQVDTCHGEPSPPSDPVTTILLLNNDYNLAVVDNTSITGQNGLPILIGNTSNNRTIIFDGNNSTIRVNCATPKRIFEISTGAVVKINNLTLTQSCLTAAQDGATIYNLGSLTFTGVTLSNNGNAGKGGGIFNGMGATLNVNTSAFSGNTAYNGGAIFNLGTTFISNSTFDSNATSFGNAGAITNAGNGTLSVDHTVFRFNGAGGYSANQTSGAIYNSSSGSTIVSSSCFHQEQL